MQLLFLLAVIASLAWLPVMSSFYRAWAARRNPISLAIAVLIGFVVYVCPSMCWLLVRRTDARWVVGGMSVMSLAVCAFFYASFHWERRWFPRNKTDRRES